jgi:hypothetical protein
MRLTRLRLVNYRGVAQLEARLPPRGLTVLLGDNETGKSSLAEAIDLLFEFPDDSRRREVVATKPVHRDAGAEIEADVQAGAYAFTYRKRFHVQPRTELIVHAPTPESRTGRDAHDRVRAILRDSVDLELWRALRVSQGEIGTQPDLTAAPSLAQALANLAQEAAPREEDLLAAVRRERERYFTPTGERKRALLEAETKLQRLREEVAVLTHSAEELDADAERVAELELQVATLADERESLVTIERQLLAEAEAARARHAQREHASTVEAAADARVRRTEKLIRLLHDGAALPAAIAAAQQAREQSARDAAAAEAELAAADASVAAARAELDRARANQAAAQAADKLSTCTRTLHDLRAVQAELAQTPALDAATVEHLASLASAWQAAQARLSAQATSVELRAHEPVTVRLGLGEQERIALDLAAGEVREFAVPESLRLEVPQLQISLRAGQGATALSAAAEGAGAALRHGLARAQCTDVAQARTRLAAQRERERAAQELEGVLRRLLSVERSAQFDAALTRLRDEVASRHGRAEATAERVDVTELQQHVEAVTAKQRQLQRTALDRQATLARAQRAEQDAQSRLAANAAARAALGEPGDGGDLASAQAQLTDAAQQLQRARDALAAVQQAPMRSAAQVNAELQQRRARATEVEDTLQRARETLTALRTRLTVRGDEGLAERAGRSEAELARLAQAVERDRRRAAAVELLYGALLAARDDCVQTYHLPIKDGIEQLGRAVFGASFQVALDERLQITQRTLHGITVPFRELSLGAREQLAILLRLACAMAVAPRAGVPVLLDDALGQSDPERLRAMGLALQLAGQRCQIILLTCAPQRAQWPGAHVIRMPSRAEPGRGASAAAEA